MHNNKPKMNGILPSASKLCPSAFNAARRNFDNSHPNGSLEKVLLFMHRFNRIRRNKSKLLSINTTAKKMRTKFMHANNGICDPSQVTSISLNKRYPTSSSHKNASLSHSHQSANTSRWKVARNTLKLSVSSRNQEGTGGSPRSLRKILVEFMSNQALTRLLSNLAI